MAHRSAQRNEFLRRQLAQRIRTDLEFPPGVLVTVTAVEVSADLCSASVWVSVLPADQSAGVVRSLQARARELQAALFSAVRFRPVPSLRFRADTSEAQAADVEALLDRLAKE